MVNLTSFLASFNIALVSRKRSFQVSGSFYNVAFVHYLYKSGYILGYHRSGLGLTVYPNYASVLYKRFVIVSTNSRPIYFSKSRALKLYKKGFSYFFYFGGQFFDSQTAVLCGKGGLVLGFFE